MESNLWLLPFAVDPATAGWSKSFPVFAKALSQYGAASEDASNFQECAFKNLSVPNPAYLVRFLL